jgi:hypothetical protein
MNIKNLNKNLLTSLPQPIIYKLHPMNVTGYFDGEGCFNVTVYLNPKMNTGYSVSITAEFKQHSNSYDLLYSLKNFFNNKGTISFSNKTKTVLRYKISNLDDIINLVLPHFDSYPLMTSKQLNYLDFKKIIIKIKNKEHLTIKGINEIKNIIKNMNTHRKFEEKWNFCYNQVFVEKIKISPEWLSSFADSEGHFKFFYKGVGLNNTNKNKNSSNCAFSISQNVHDFHIMNLILNFFKSGNLYPLSVNESYDSAYKYYTLRNSQNLNSVIEFIIGSRELNKNIIIPFFDQYPLYTTKSLDFKDWKTLIELADNKAYLTEEGRLKMINLSKGLNNSRKLDLLKFNEEN